MATRSQASIARHRRHARHPRRPRPRPHARPRRGEELFRHHGGAPARAMLDAVDMRWHPAWISGCGVSGSKESMESPFGDPQNSGSSGDGSAPPQNPGHQKERKPLWRQWLWLVAGSPVVFRTEAGVRFRRCLTPNQRRVLLGRAKLMAGGEMYGKTIPREARPQTSASIETPTNVGTREARIRRRETRTPADAHGGLSVGHAAA